MEKTNKTKYIFEKTLDVFAWLCLFFAIILSTLTVAAAMSGEDNGHEIFGHKLLIVNTGSMSKSPISEDEEIFFNAGDVIIIETLDNVNVLKAGDVITFFSYNPSSMGKTVSHKIREINYDQTGAITGIVTYGINTGVNDMVEVKPEHVIGRYVAKIPSVGNLFSFLKTPRGFYLSILIPGVLLIIFFSVKVGKILGRQQYAKQYNQEVDVLKERVATLEGKEGSIVYVNNGQGEGTPQNTQGEEQGMDQNVEQNAQQVEQQTTQQSEQQPASQFAQTQPVQQGAPVVYQTVSINYQPMPVAYQPVMCQPMPMQMQPVCFAPMGGQMPSAPVIQQSVPNQVGQPICQSISWPTANMCFAPSVSQVAPSQQGQQVYQTISGVTPQMTGYPVYYQPVAQPVQQQAPVAQPAGEQAPVVQPTPVATPEQTQQVPTTPVVESAPVEKEQPKVEQPVLKEDVQEIEELATTQDETEEVSEGKFNFPESQKKPFAEKLAEAKQETQDYFNAIHNELVSYKKVSSRISLRCASYRKGRTLLAKIGLRGKTLTAYFNLDVKEFNEKVFFQKDMSSLRAYEEVPFAVKIKSERACHNATKLVTALAEKFQLAKNPKLEQQNQDNQKK